jgi:hypothetical protein
MLLLPARGCRRTIITLHHTGKAESAQDYRASSDIKASVDIAYKLTVLADGSRPDLIDPAGVQAAHHAPKVLVERCQVWEAAL